MKKLFFFVAALALAMSSMAATHHLYIDNQTGWEATALYAWADGKPDRKVLVHAIAWGPLLQKQNLGP